MILASAGLAVQIFDKIAGGNSENVDGLKNIIQETKTLYNELTPQQRTDLYNGMNGQTETFLGPVNNREAFVKGKAFGKDVFKIMKEKISKMVSDEEMTWEQGQKFKKKIDYCASLKPEQREAIAEMVTFMCQNM